MSSSTVQKIKERLPIIDVIGGYIDVEKSGASFKAKCPFHNEKTASFYISPDRGSYYCFGCGAKGDIFSFVQEFEGVDFVASLKMLADRAGVTLDKYERTEKDPKERLFEAMNEAVKFFQSNLRDNKEALLYLKDRKLSIETLRDWKLGFALPEWRSLKEYLRNKGFTEQEILDAGLAKENEKGGESYDRFRGRIMFPIFDTASMVCGFSGRVIAKDEEPKYLNSPDTILFDKSRVLYGFNIAKNSMREKGYAVLVEGQMDLLLSHQAGISNTVASSGTALSAHHLEMIKRLAPTVVIAYDADNAGRNATFRAWKLALSLGLNVKIALLPNGLDPADAVVKDPQIWKDAVENSKNIVDYFIEVMKSESSVGASDKVLKEKLLPLVKSVASSIDQSRFLQKISFASGVGENALREEMARISEDYVEAPVKPLSKHKDSQNVMKGIGFLLWLKSHGSDYASKFESELRRIIPSLIDKDIGEDEKSALLFEIDMHYSFDNKVETVGGVLLRKLEDDVLKDQFARAMERLKKAEAIHDSEAVDRELRLCQELSEKISRLSKAT